MIDVNTFLLMLLYILGMVLLIILIILGIKLIGTVSKIDNIIDELEIRLGKMDKMFSAVDIVTDSMALISDKIVDAICYFLKKIFTRDKGKEEDTNE